VAPWETRTIPPSPQLSVSILSHEDQKYLWQWGDNGAWKNFVLVHPESGSAIVVFTNGDTGMRVAERVVQAATRRAQPAFLWV
jgi:hypothetical protein